MRLKKKLWVEPMTLLVLMLSYFTGLSLLWTHGEGVGSAVRGNGQMPVVHLSPLSVQAACPLGPAGDVAGCGIKVSSRPHVGPLLTGLAVSQCLPDVTCLDVQTHVQQPSLNQRLCFDEILNQDSLMIFFPPPES